MVDGMKISADIQRYYTSIEADVADLRRHIEALKGVDGAETGWRGTAVFFFQLGMTSARLYEVAQNVSALNIKTENEAIADLHELMLIASGLASDVHGVLSMLEISRDP